jgi:hypothetical protein
MGGRVVLTLIVSLVIPVAGWTPTADASGTATVRILDSYNHSRVRISFDNVDRVMHNGDRTGLITVTPDAMRNDVITVQALRYHKCGIAKIGWYFHAGHEYRLRINQVEGGRCQTGSGGSVAGPAPHVHDLS